MSKFETSGNGHKLGIHISKRRFHLKNIQNNISNLMLQIAKDKGIDLSNDTVINPIIEQFNDTLIESEQLYNIIDEEKVLLNGNLQSNVNLQSDVLTSCGYIELVENGVYLISALGSVISKKTGMFNYLQVFLSDKEDAVDKLCYNSVLLNTSFEKGYIINSNLTHTISITQPTKLFLLVKVGFLSGNFVFDCDNSKIVSVKL